MQRFLLLILAGITVSNPAFASNCDQLAGLSLQHGKITLAVAEPAGTLTGLSAKPLEGLPAFCRVAATLTPSSGSNIRIEVWMPDSNWNGRYQGTGNGGYAGAVLYDPLANALRSGYAVANTDMGTSSSSMNNGDSLIGHPEMWQDWGSRSTHEMTLAAKQIIQAFYGTAPVFSYFVGCSTGGQQGLVEAQRFPDDYDGILAGAPPNNRTRLHMDFIWDFASSQSAPGGNIPASKLSLIRNTVLNACTAEKAVPSDNFLSNPNDCHWDPAELLCKTNDTSDCLTPEQVATARKMYQGPKDPVTHAAIYQGPVRGSEPGWAGLLMPAGGSPFLDSLFKWTFGATWNWRTFDFHRDVAIVDAKLGPMVNATSPNLQQFQAHGHKLIVYQGWDDAIVPPLESINYYRSVEDAQADHAASHHRSKSVETQEFYRLFMVPGMAHCSGGPGLNTISPLESLEQWVEKKIPPESLVAIHTDNGATQITRPVCPYPQVARYNGTGDANKATNFSCQAPSKQNSK